jgi:protein-disulfide isomerase
MTVRRTFGLLIALAVCAAAACGGARRNIDLRQATRLGPAGAQAEVVVFSDFQCPFCKRAAAEMHRLHRARPNRAKFYFKHFPLGYHPQALQAAQAAEAARRQGKFWEMHDLLFANAQELNDESYRRLALELGLDVELFERDRASFDVQNRVAADRAEGEALGVDGVPYFLINGVPFHGAYDELAEQLESFGRAR